MIDFTHLLQRIWPRKSAALSFCAISQTGIRMSARTTRIHVFSVASQQTEHKFSDCGKGMRTYCVCVSLRQHRSVLFCTQQKKSKSERGPINRTAHMLMCHHIMHAFSPWYGCVSDTAGVWVSKKWSIYVAIICTCAFSPGLLYIFCRTRFSSCGHAFGGIRGVVLWKRPSCEKINFRSNMQVAENILVHIL